MNTELLAAVNRYVNLIHEKRKRDYALSYVDWLRRGCVGNKPDGRCSYLQQQAVHQAIAELTKNRPLDLAN